MPRDGTKVRRRLQEAALALYETRGYERTTTAEIAAAAGVTERTFFRHFPDKREVLFDGEAALSAILVAAIREAPPALGPWAVLRQAFGAANPLLVENRPLSEPRRRIIAASPALQERELAKSRSLSATLASALRERGVPGRPATLAAQIGLAAYGQAFAAWLDEPAVDLGEHLARAFRDVAALASGP